MATAHKHRRKRRWTTSDLGETSHKNYQMDYLKYVSDMSLFEKCIRYVSVLFCTEVAAMGVHCPDLCLGVSLGRENVLIILYLNLNLI